MADLRSRAKTLRAKRVVFNAVRELDLDNPIELDRMSAVRSLDQDYEDYMTRTMRKTTTTKSCKLRKTMTGNVLTCNAQ